MISSAEEPRCEKEENEKEKRKNSDPFENQRDQEHCERGGKVRKEQLKAVDIYFTVVVINRDMFFEAVCEEDCESVKH